MQIRTLIAASITISVATVTSAHAAASFYEGKTMRIVVGAAPEGTPKDRVQILRKAFMDTIKDPEFLAEAKKANLDLDPVSGEDLERTIGAFFKLEPSISNKLREILK